MKLDCIVAAVMPWILFIVGRKSKNNSVSNTMIMFLYVAFMYLVAVITFVYMYVN